MSRYSWMGQTWRVMILAFATALVITGSLFVFGLRTGTPLSNLTSDPAMVTGTAIRTGVLSNLGVMIWSSSAACAFLGAVLQRKHPRRLHFFLVSGLLSSVLSLDDLLTIHDHILPHYFHIPERISYAGYLLFVAIYLIVFLKYILAETDYPVLAIALLFFGVSIVMRPEQTDKDLKVFIKDSLKFFGIVFWLVYYFRAVVRSVHIEEEGPHGAG